MLSGNLIRWPKAPNGCIWVRQFALDKKHRTWSLHIPTELLVKVSSSPDVCQGKAALDVQDITSSVFRWHCIAVIADGKAGMTTAAAAGIAIPLHELLFLDCVSKPSVSGCWWPVLRWLLLQSLLPIAILYLYTRKSWCWQIYNFDCCVSNLRLIASLSHWSKQHCKPRARFVCASLWRRKRILQALATQ